MTETAQNIPVLKEVKPKRIYKVKLTTKQKTALGLLEMDPNMTPTEAMRQAGYAPTSYQSPGKTLLARTAVKQASDKWIKVLAAHNIHTERLAEKYDQLLDAKKKDGLFDVNDNAIQLKTAEILRKTLVHDVPTGAEERSVTFKWKKPGQ